MIVSYKSKALRQFAETGNPRKLPVPNHDTVARILALIGAVERPAELAAFAKYRFHPLKQYDPLRYSMDVTGNWRITFAWEGSDAVEVDIEDPH